MSSEREVDLMRRIADKDRRAFEELYEIYHRRLHHFLWRFTRQPELIEEIANDVLFVVWQRAASFRGGSRPSTWIFGIAYRTALKSIGRLKRRPEEPLSEDLESVAEERPDHHLALREIHRTVRKALGRLSPEHRAVVELVYYYGYSCREVSAIVGCPVNTVKTRMFHARRRLRDLLPRLDPNLTAAQNGGTPG